ncbi:MAG: galactose mutarotase [Lachnospiraceae bacterium]|nr:galactose mutarotase [Lachnospiraceae bacterium]
MEQIRFGAMKDGTNVCLFTLKNKNGMKAVVTDLGAGLVALYVPDKNGDLVDVVTGYQTVDEYERNPMNFGACIGRNGNRIDNARFTLNGKTYELAETQPTVNLHSGPNGYCKRKWNFETEVTEDSETVIFYINSPDGDQGYPGNMDVEVSYTLTDDNELMLEYYGQSDQDTVMNMTNHTYFNLNGHDSGTVLNHRLTLLSDAYCLADERQVTTGEVKDVTGTPFDFRTEKTLGQDIFADDPDLIIGKGYDSNFIINGDEVKEEAEYFGRLVGDKSGIVMEMYTDLPGVQLYTANKTDYPNGKDGAYYQQHCAACFETQYAPNAVNIPSFVSPIIKAGEERTTLTVYRFTTE